LYLENILATFNPMPQPDFPHYHHLAHFWSLAVEEQFYLVWPFVVWVLDRKQLFRFAVGLIVLALIFRLVLLHLGIGVYYFTPCRIDTLACGALLAIQGTEYFNTPLFRRFALIGGVLSVLFVFAAYFLLGGFGSPW